MQKSCSTNIDLCFNGQKIKIKLAFFYNIRRASVEDFHEYSGYSEFKWLFVAR